MTILTPRELHLFPLNAMLRLSTAAGWNQLEADWSRIIALSPGLCFGLEVDGELAATATAFLREPEVAWIGMVLTLPEHRGKGLARQLVGHLLDLLSAQGIRQIGLDATNMGAPLYRSLGFRQLCPIQRWARAGSKMMPFRGDGWKRQDTPLLESLASEATMLSVSSAKLFLRPGRTATYLGPFTASRESAAVELLDRVPRQGSLLWDLFPHHPYAQSLATRHGFIVSRMLVRMTLGPPMAPPGYETLGIAGFEFG